MEVAEIRVDCAIGRDDAAQSAIGSPMLGTAQVGGRSAEAIHFVVAPPPALKVYLPGRGRRGVGGGGVVEAGGGAVGILLFDMFQYFLFSSTFLSY